MTLEAWGGGPGLVDSHTRIAREMGIDILYGARVVDLLHDGHAVHGVRFKQGPNRSVGEAVRIEAVKSGAVILTA